MTASWQSILLGLGICYTTSILVSFFSKELATMFNADPDFVRIASRGFRMTFILTPFIIFNLVGSGLFQATGESRRSLLIAVSRIVFFILPLMMILPNLFGIDGIWLAFISGEALSAVFATLVTLPALLGLHSAAKKARGLEGEVASAENGL